LGLRKWSESKKETIPDLGWGFRMGWECLLLPIGSRNPVY